MTHSARNGAPAPVERVRQLARQVTIAPPSKSLTNRALVLGALAAGTSRILRPLHSQDTQVLCSALACFGVAIEGRGGNVIVVAGTGGRLLPPGGPVDVAMSGTALRFLTAVACLAEGPVVITGSPRLRERPMADLVLALRRMGIDVESVGARGRPPIRVTGAGFPGGRTRLSGRVSSQFLSALLMLGPYGRADLEVMLRARPVSEPYVELTVDLMRRFGADVEVSGDGRRYRVRTGPPYRAGELEVEGDASSASYFFALAAMLGVRVTVENIAAGSRQGDLGLLELLARMGCRVERGSESVTIEGGSLSAIEADMVDMPDMVPTLAVAALVARGTTRIRNVANLRLKESDRLRALATELNRVGARVEEHPDGLTIDPAQALRGSPVTVRTYDDHRIAMSFAVLGVVRGGISIEDPACVAKSYPGFWRDLALLTGSPEEAPSRSP